MSEVILMAKCTTATRFAHLECIIEGGLRTFVEVGQALLEIRDARLYRQTHPTFEAYCKERWGMSDRHARRQIQAAEIALSFGPMGPLLPSERHARELAPLKNRPDEMREAWMDASSNGEPTTQEVREIVARKMGVHYSSETTEWSTPRELFEILDSEFKFTLDVCATPENAKCPRFFTKEHDGLTQNWSGVCWMNPPYGDEIKSWFKKAWEASEAGATVVCLAPSRTDTNWFHDYCHERSQTRPRNRPRRRSRMRRALGHDERRRRATGHCGRFHVAAKQDHL